MPFPPVLSKTNEDSFAQLQIAYQQLFRNNKELMDGIHYAQLIQQGILPQERHMKRLFRDYFVMYKPQSIIGGDLYWVGQKDNLQIFAVADCTGHGVSGALLSVLALSFLNYVILGKHFSELHEVLEELDKKWIETFHQGIEFGFDNDWMEIGICAFNPETRELQYSGAFNKVTCISGSEVLIRYGSRYPIGGWQLEKSRTYENHTLILPENSMVYLHSDGVKDQFGSANGKRFGSRRLAMLLENVAYLPVGEQKRRIESELEAWKGEELQTDDICLMGVRL
ncbi:MAG TPA: SpoIIE family protein phosphatase [Bacteroidia bacterium]|jgi:serine phosphatase RsbU (regulator of sigma subunit)|nr:SpoIIE family protein phosphatase [Bacteroidia bacterium]